MAEKEGFAPGTGAVPAPARGAEKPFTGWFFASAGFGRALLTPPSFIATKKKHHTVLSFVAEKEGFARQSPQPTPLAGETKVANCLGKIGLCM